MRFLRPFLIRIVLVLVGCAVLTIAIQMNLNAGTQIVAGLFAPESPMAIVVSIVRLAMPAVGLWLIYRGLR